MPASPFMSSSAPSKPASSPRLPGVIWATGWVSFLTDLSTEMVYPLLAKLYQTALGLNFIWQGVIEGFAEAVASLTKLLSGHWSDRTGGRKWWMVVGYSLSGLSKPLLGSSGSGWTVLALRGADRVGKGIRGAPRDALMAQVVDPAQRGSAFGLQRAMDHAGALSGALLASFVLYMGWVELRELFWWTLVPSTLAVLVIVAFVHERRGASEASPAIRAAPGLSAAAWTRQPLAMKRYLGVLAVFALGNSTDQLLLLRASQQLSAAAWSESQVLASLPLLWAWLHVVKALSSIAGGRWSDRFGRKPSVMAGWLLYALVYAGFALWSSAAAPWILFGVYGIYYGLVEAPERALVADLCPDPAVSGTSFGLYHFILGISALPASALCGCLWYFFNHQTAFLAGAVFSLLAMLLLPWALGAAPKSAKA